MENAAPAQPKTQQRPQTEKTAEQQCADLLTWLRKPGRTQAQLDEQYSAVDGHGLLDLEIPDPQTGNKAAMRDHLNAIRATLPEG